MASGKTHDLITWYCFIPCLAWGWEANQNFFMGLILSSGFLFAGLMFGPDLDTKSLQYYRWGFLRFFWIPYQKAGGHRSFVSQSHDALWGPFIRFIYLGLPICFLFIVFLLFKQQNFNFSEVLDKFIDFSFNYQKLIVLFFLGTWLGSLSHHLADWFCAFKNLKQSRS